MTDTPTPHVLVVTSSGSAAAVVVPVLAALEAGGMRVRAIDVGAAGGGGASVADRLRRALLGESAERRLRKELEGNPPDVAVAFDPHAAAALTVARDAVGAASPVVAVVADLEPGQAWGEAAADRFCASDAETAVALADLGVEGERVLVVGPVGPRAWADAGGESRDALRARFKLSGQVSIVEVAGMGAEQTSSLAMQLSLAEVAEHTTFLFDAGTDADAAAVLRAKVPVLGLRAKLFGATADAPLLWRCADAAVMRPRLESVAKGLLVGSRLVLLLDDTIPGAAKTAAALEARKSAVIARSPLLVSAALESALRARGGPGQSDGAETIADVVWVVAGDRRAVIEERRAAERAEVHEKVRAATSAAQAAAKVAAAPGELEDLSGGVDRAPSEPVPDPAQLARLLAETQARKKEMERAMMAAREAADRWTKQGDTARAEVERARMHSLLGELGQLETELRELERAVAGVPRSTPRSEPPPRAAAPPPPPRVDPRPPPKAAPAPSVDDELAALKRKMAQTPKKKP